MINKPMDVLEQFPIRRSKQQKQAFRDDIQAFAQNQGYQVTVEKGSRGAQNVVIGKPEAAKYLVTAHYDTPASIGIPNFLTPCNPVAFYVYQMLLVGLFFLAAFIVGFVVSFFTENKMLIFWSAYLAYFGMLFLMLFGPANRNNANDNTSGVVTVLEILLSMPENMRARVAFVLFDLEEMGLVGSASYRKMHKAQTENQIILNLDCVGDGEHIVFFPLKKARKNEALLEQLRSVCTKTENRDITLRAKGFAAGSSDHKNFPNGVGIMAFHKAKFIGLYCDRIHTWRDTILDQTNVNILTEAITTLICQ